MTQTHSAARADSHHVWPQGLRITETEPASCGTSAKPRRGTNVELLRTASLYLQAGWRWLERKRTQQLLSRRLRVAETISLGEKRSVSIIRVDGAQFLIGCSSSSVQLLAVLDTETSGQTNRSSEIERAS